LFEDPIELFKALGVRRDDRILEIGCCIGYHTLPLLQIASHGKVYANDVWKDGLTYLERKIGSNKNIEIICYSAEAIKLPSSSLDKVVCFDTLHDVPNLEYAIERWTEFLREAGKFFYQDPKIPPEKIQTLSRDKLRQTGKIKGVHVFIRQ
jgi:ubiquinone/menaquinone biosynthesis C-methylase UbiE